MSRLEDQRRAAARLEELRTEASYHRQRFDLYRAKTYGPRPTSATRLRELEQASDAAAARLRHAEGEEPLRP